MKKWVDNFIFCFTLSKWGDLYMDLKRISEIINKQKKEQAKIYFICMNKIIKENNLNGNKNKYTEYFLERNILYYNW